MKGGDDRVKEKNNLLTVMGVAVVVAVIASVITTSITGNTLRVADIDKTQEIYTKVEIDTKLKEANSPVMDSYKFERPSTKLFLGKSLTDVNSASLDDSEMPNFLKKASIKNFGYEQKISIGKDLTFQEFSDKDYENGKKTLGIPINRKSILTYEIEFKQQPTFKDLMNQEIYFLGEKYLITSVLPVSDSLSNLGDSLTLEDKNGNVLILKSENKIKINGVFIDSFPVTIIKNNNKIAKISINWKPTDEFFLTQENNIVMPIPNQVGLKFEGTSTYDREIAGNIYLYGLAN